jgi:FKBP-type peptidyl-prolyl cis-trans isomerase FkpA
MRLRSLILAGLVPMLVACEPTAPPGPSDPATETFAPSLGVDIASMVKVDKNLYYKDLVVGTGTPTASFAKTVTVFYTGWFKDGTQFDSNVGKDSAVFVLTDAGANGLIAGWVIGIDGMKPGGSRKLVIGSSYAYGSKGRPGVPPNSTLVFDIELRSVK